MKHFIMSLFGAAALLIASPSFAQVNVEEVRDFAEDAMSTQCADKLKEAAQAAGPKWQEMRQACAAFRGCKKSCRQAKRNAKRGVRAEKRDCKAECKGKKGKAKRNCKKSCRQSARAGKKDARQAKRNCKRECRAAYLQGPCKTARKAFWREVANQVKRSAGQCAKDIQALMNG